MSTPLVSFCIPTYNRSRYLDSLLYSLTEHLAGFPYPYEVFVSDNASEDDTPAIVANYAPQLPLRYVRHESNRGGRANYQYMMANAKGRYLIYIADDDGIIGHRVASVIAAMEANPDVGIAYAPWKLLDLVADRDLGQFYQQDRDIRIERGDYRGLLDTLLHYRIFPEIYVCRRELVQQVMPRIHEQAYYAFVHASEFVQHAPVLLLHEPYYVSVTNYFADHQRTQGGTEEAETSWDRYRGGLEYVLGRALPQMGDVDRQGYLTRIQDMIADRISVAVRLRLEQQRDAVETYYLAYRLKALGRAQILPLGLEPLRAAAALSFLLNDPELNRDITEMVCLGYFEPQLREHIEKHCRHRTRFVSSPQELQALSDDILVLARGAIGPADLPAGSCARFVHDSMLLQKFVG
ncbi:MAG: glycosyltransferase family 2 protein [Roseateles depolymerans]|uniref:Glycosyltransferase family 2 protein n=1 Tax=Roseateles depolymerans TaxID=76731 RepID=A0A2W5E2D9_9BURK|nr:MAG: glycosyltransferase family 2 protein [Roseateles depolymerans]